MVGLHTHKKTNLLQGLPSVVLKILELLEGLREREKKIGRIE